ncbi:MAG: hypothetical protein V3W34_17060 [Phycisphaerae bacterium]
MSWLKKRSSNRRKRPRRASNRFAVLAGMVRRFVAVRGLRHLWMVPVLSGVAWGVHGLEAFVLNRPEYLVACDIYLADAPEYLEESILAVIAPAAATAWTDPDLCRRIGAVLEESAWVRQVNEVRRYAGGSVVVSCDYRGSAALVQFENDHYLIAADGVRLPGVYSYYPSLVVVQGVSAPPPVAGERWPGEDIKAALDIIERLQEEPFFDQVTGVLVGNYDGRRDKRQPHILLAVAPSGSRIVWGSAPGLEIEENTVGEKIQILARNFLSSGRIDAGYDCIDISVYPDRFTTRGLDKIGQTWKKSAD